LIQEATMKNLSLTVFLFTLTFCKAVSQCAYNFSVSSDVYQSLTNATSINQGQVWTKYSSFTVPLGFTFPLTAGRSITSVNVFSGALDFPTSTSGYYYLAIYHWPYSGTLLTDNGYGTSISESPISYVVSGTAGNRIAKIEFNNAGLEFDHDSSYCGGTTGLDYVNFQYWLYESNGRIEIHFGPSSVNNPNSYTCAAGGYGRVMKFIVDNYMINPYNNVNSPTVACLNNTGVVYGNPMTSTTANNGLLYVYDPDPNYSITTGINNSEKNKISIYPNPTQNIINIRFPLENIKKEYLIHDITGRLAKRGPLSETLNVSDLDRGVYLFTVENETVKLIIGE
jgi:hypothetical protein